MVESSVLVVDKPGGMTSHDVVARVRKILATPRSMSVGHAGTLDPMATGVIVIAIGEATKLVPFLTSTEKEYAATIALGIETDTLDADGRETSRKDPPEGWRDRVTVALAEEKNRTSQLPPIFSAIHAKGARSYELARRGEAVELAEREVKVAELELGEIVGLSVSVKLAVSKGYYVRALARDFAARLGTVGHLTALRRTRAGEFTLAEAVPLATVDSKSARIPLGVAARRVLPAVTLTEPGVAHARAGRAVPLADFSDGAPGEGERAWFSASGSLVAIGRIEEGVGRVTRGFTY